MTPLADINDFNGAVDNSIIFTIDMAGYKLANGNNIVSESSTFADPPMLFTEWLTLNDLMKNQGTSDFTMKFRKQRNKSTGMEVRLAKLKDAVIDGNGNITYYWETPATKEGEDPNAPKFKVDPARQFEIEPNPEKKYTLAIQIVDFMKWIDTQPEGKELTSRDIKDVLEVSYVKVFNTAPSFHWQGMNYRASQMDASVYPTDIGDPQWRKKHGDYSFLDKHLTGLINSMAFWRNPMASMANKRLKNLRNK